MPLPRIACFHGGGSNSQIYEMQCSQLAELLKHDFQLVYFDGPFDRPAGPGVLPAFRDYGPYHSWFKTDTSSILGSLCGSERSDGSGFDEQNTDGVERVLEQMANDKTGGGGPWVGAIGFSQGSRVVGGLLLAQQQRRQQQTEEGSGGTNIKLQFGVLCMGSGAPMESKGVKSSELVRMPTLHVHGLKDMFLPLGRHQFSTYYDTERAQLFEVDYHHAMPWVKHEAQELAALMRKLYRETKDT